MVYHCVFSDFSDDDKLIFKKEFLEQLKCNNNNITHKNICVQENSKNKETKKFISIPRTSENDVMFDALEKYDMLMFGLMNDPNSNNTLNDEKNDEKNNDTNNDTNFDTNFELYGSI